MFDIYIYILIYIYIIYIYIVGPKSMRLPRLRRLDFKEVSVSSGPCRLQIKLGVCLGRISGTVAQMQGIIFKNIGWKRTIRIKS